MVWNSKKRSTGRSRREETGSSRMWFGHTALNSTLFKRWKHAPGTCEFCGHSSMSSCFAPNMTRTRKELRDNLRGRNLELELVELLQKICGEQSYWFLFQYLSTNLIWRIWFIFYLLTLINATFSCLPTTTLYTKEEENRRCGQLLMREEEQQLSAVQSLFLSVADCFWSCCQESAPHLTYHGLDSHVIFGFPGFWDCFCYTFHWLFPGLCSSFRSVLWCPVVSVQSLAHSVFLHSSCFLRRFWFPTLILVRLSPR